MTEDHGLERVAMRRRIARRGARPSGCRALAALIAASASLALAGPAYALDLTVDSTADTPDANPGNGICADSTGGCTLRAAVEEARVNDDPGDQDTVTAPAATYQLTLAPASGGGQISWDAGATGDALTVAGAGAGSTTIEQTVAGEGIVSESSPLVLSGLTLTGGDATDGGAITAFGADLTIERVTVTQNAASTTGGGIRFVGFPAGTLTIADSQITDNQSAHFGGGGINAGSGDVTIARSTIAGNIGGGIDYVDTGGAGDLTIEDSTVAGNEDVDATSAPAGGIFFRGNQLQLTASTVSGNMGTRGGGIWLGQGALAAENSTISGNSATNGGGIYAAPAVGSLTITANLTQTTIADNAASAGSGILGSGASTSIHHTATIFSANGCDAVIGSTLVSGGFNVEQGDSCHLDQPTDQTNVDPMLGPLQSNGGPTETHALAATSFARDAVTSGCPPPAVDQRGVARPQGAACDSGSFELVAAPSPPELAPSLTLIERRRQRVARLKVKLGCGPVACAARVGGRARIPRPGAKALTVRLRPRRLAVAADAIVTVRLKFRHHRRAVRRIRRLLRKGGRRVRRRARVVVRATAMAAGGTDSARLRIRLRP